MKRDKYNRAWITENSIDICGQYEDGILTLRGLHYQLVARGMTNTIQHYKRVVNAMIKARRQGLINYSQFSDHDREKIGDTEYEETVLSDEINNAEDQIQAWMTGYSKNRWENQNFYVELWIEKKALQGIFGPIAEAADVALCPCKGYPSLTFLYEASLRFSHAVALDKEPQIIYFGDHDPSGEDIPRSIGDNFRDDFGIDLGVDVRALTKEQCLELKLPPSPTKVGDSRSANFTGIGQVELDAVPPKTLQKWGRDSIREYFDKDLYNELKEQEDQERVIYRRKLKNFVKTL